MGHLTNGEFANNGKPFWSMDSLHNATDASVTASGSAPSTTPPSRTTHTRRHLRRPDDDLHQPSERLSARAGSALIGAGGPHGSFAVNCDPSKPPCPWYTTYNFDSPDIIGTPRPQADRYDIGAWQSLHTATPK